VKKGQPDRGKCTGEVLLDKRPAPYAAGVPFELLSIHFDDGGTAMTVHDIADRLGMTLKTGDWLTIALSKTPAKAQGRVRK
jgi:hypothetical protein